MFTAWVGQCLVPTLKPGDIIIVADNPGSHKGLPARQLIRKVGAQLLFLPPYSPDLNPKDLRRENGPPDRFLILVIFAKLKTLFRKAEERTIAASWPKLGTLLAEFTAKERKNYLRMPGILLCESHRDRVPPHGVARWQQGRPRCAFAWLAVRAALRMGIGDLGWVWVASLNLDLQNPDDRRDDGAEWLA